MARMYRRRRAGGLRRRRAAPRNPYRRKRMAVGRRVLNPMPTFVETYKGSIIQSNTGQAFKARITDIPQWQNYAALYNQYRINWIKVLLIPDYNGMSSDANASSYNVSQALPAVGMARIAWAIQDSPNQVAPANEAAVLQDNGAKVRALGVKWSCSFKGVPDINQDVTGGTMVGVKPRYREFYNFDSTTTGNNPQYGSCLAYLTEAQNATVPGGINIQVYYKVSFTLRDPK